MMENKSNFKHIQVIDPTKNVLMHVEGAVKRLDDLRQTEFERVHEVSILNIKRIDDLRLAESRRVDEEAKMREDFAEKLRDAEAKRIDAIRAVDVNAVAVASERASAQAAILANQVTQSADALRTLVATTAATMAQQQDQASRQFNDRLGQVEKAQYESKGKSGMADPLLTDLIDEVKLLKSIKSSDVGERKGRGDVIGWIVGGVMFLIAAITFVVSILP